MQVLKIIGTNEQKVYHDYHKPFICSTSGIFPKMYNGGWNDFHFAESIDFTFENMPLLPKLYGNKEHENENYKWFTCTIEVMDATGKTKSGYYYATLDKKQGKIISQNVDFS